MNNKISSKIEKVRIKKMNYKLILTFVIILLISANVSATDGALFKFNLYQQDPATGDKILLYVDSTEVAEHTIISGFIGPFSVELEVTEIDSVKVHFLMHLITLGPKAENHAETYAVEYGLPARIEDINSKNNSKYIFDIIPMKMIEIDSSRCGYNHRTKKDFTFQPTANFDIYYVPSTLGDFFFDSIKELLEANFRKYKAKFNLNMPGKTLIYVPPCPIHSVIWDMRFGMATDPTRNTAFAIYNKDVTTVDPFIATHTVILRTYGYSAPFLAEGFSNYFSFAIYDMKKILAEKKDFAIEPLLSTYQYYTANPRETDKTATTFVKYLIDQYHVDKFMELYKQADDLNLKESIESTYGKDIKNLEAEWKNYVDTFQINLQEYGYFASFAEMMMDYPLAHAYNLEHLKHSPTRNDSLSAMNSLKRSAYFTGNYYYAADLCRELLTIKEKDAALWMELAAYELMNGEYDKAYKDLKKAEQLDPHDELIKFNLAYYYIIKEKYDEAKEILKNNFRTGKSASAQIETRILLADMFARSSADTDKELAEKNYNEALNMYKGILQANVSNSTVYFWMGRAHLGLNDYTQAINNLHIAEFLESRPFYQGMISLWLGKAYLQSGNKEQAKEYLSLVFSFASADYTQTEAKQLLKNLK